MLIDDKYSIDKFDKSSVQQRKKLSKILSEEINKQLHPLVLKKVKTIIDQLNQKGHNIRLYYDPKPGDISFRDDFVSAGEYKCKLRIAVDTIVSVAYEEYTVNEYAKFDIEKLIKLDRIEVK